ASPPAAPPQVPASGTTMPSPQPPHVPPPPEPTATNGITDEQMSKPYSHLSGRSATFTGSRHQIFGVLLPNAIFFGIYHAFSQLGSQARLTKYELIRSCHHEQGGNHDSTAFSSLMA
ncbi:hypothetical protein Vretimale_6315, partial [Volvox reticuliferus]